MFWVISHCYEVIFHLWQSLSGRGEPVGEGPELSVSRSDLSTFSVIYFLLWSRAREPSNLCPGTMTRHSALFALTHYSPRGPHQYFKVQAQSWVLTIVDTVSVILTIWPWPHQGTNTLMESYLETFRQVSSDNEWVKKDNYLVLCSGVR